jgi:hypothetical protein
MRNLLITLTVIEVALVVAVLAIYLTKINRSLRTISDYLGKVTFGVRAIETQLEPVGPGVTRVNQQLAGVAEAMEQLRGLAASPDGGSARG